MNAWLVTWEWMGQHAAVEKPLIAILDRRIGYARISDFVRWTYASSLSAYDWLDALKTRRFAYEPVRGTVGGIPCDFEMSCGHNPWVFARLVKNVRVQGNGDGAKLCWDRWTLPDEAYERLGIDRQEKGSFSIRLDRNDQSES
jgi:hypothetical protein